MRWALIRVLHISAQSHQKEGSNRMLRQEESDYKYSIFLIICDRHTLTHAHVRCLSPQHALTHHEDSRASELASDLLHLFGAHIVHCHKEHLLVGIEQLLHARWGRGRGRGRGEEKKTFIHEKKTKMGTTSNTWKVKTSGNKCTR